VDARRRPSRILRIGGRRRRRWIRRRRGLRMNCSRYSHDGCGGEEFQKHVTASLCGVGPKIHSAPKSRRHEEARAYRVASDGPRGRTLVRNVNVTSLPTSHCEMRRARIVTDVTGGR
jgi:hypothetical protein